MFFASICSTTKIGAEQVFIKERRVDSKIFFYNIYTLYIFQIWSESYLQKYDIFKRIITIWTAVTRMVIGFYQCIEVIFRGQYIVEQMQLRYSILFQWREWNKEAEKKKPQNKSPSLFRCIVRMFGVQYALLGIIVFIEVWTSSYCKPTFIWDDFKLHVF